MKEILTIFLIASLTLSSSQALFPVGERAVVIRIDDVQDYGEPSLYARPEKALLQYHIDHGIPAMLSIIPTRFGQDPQLVDQVKEGLTQEIFTIAIHGWHHASFANLSRSAQVSELQYGKNKLDQILDANVLAFVPPFSQFNQDTIYAVKTDGLTLMSSSVYVGDIPRKEDGIAYLPQTVTTATVVQNDTWALSSFESVTQEIRNSWDLYGVAVIVVHPRQLVASGSEDRWQTYTNIIEWIAANQGSIIRFEPNTPETKRNFDPFLISVGIFTGLTSTLLIAFNVSASRTNRQSKRISTRTIQAADAANHTNLRNALSKLLASLSVVSLPKTEASPNTTTDTKTHEDTKYEVPAPPSEPDSDLLVNESASVLGEEAADRTIRQATTRTCSARNQSPEKWNPASIMQTQSYGVLKGPVVTCERCGRRIAEDHRYCDQCGSSTG